MSTPAFQDLIPGHHCWGCGTLNEQGLHIKSRWSGDGDESVCIWQPSPQFMAGPQHVLNGGIVAALIDCHSVCTAIAAAYREEGREIGTEPNYWYVTGSMNIRYLRPTSINDEAVLRARVTKIDGKKTTVACSLFSREKESANAEVLAIRVPLAWLEAPVS